MKKNADLSVILQAIGLIVVLPGGLLFFGYASGYDASGFDLLRDWLIAFVLSVSIVAWAASKMAREHTKNTPLGKNVSPVLAVAIVMGFAYACIKFVGYLLG